MENWGIIEGDQIKVADFELFAYLTGLVAANNNAGSNNARSHIAKRQEAWFDLNQSACSGAMTVLLLAVTNSIWIQFGHLQ